MNTIYKTLQEPDHIYRERVPAKPRQDQVFHLVKDTGDGKKIKILINIKTLGNGQTSMRVRTIGHIIYEYKEHQYEKIW